MEVNIMIASTPYNTQLKTVISTLFQNLWKSRGKFLFISVKNNHVL